MIWRDVTGFEGLYQVSDTGLVRSLDRVVQQISRHGCLMDRLYKGKILKPRVGKAGYLYLHLRNREFKKTAKVHRLVAEEFVLGRFDGAVVNHKDGNKLNNTVENLEWVTVKENNSHAVRLNLSACLKTGVDSNSSLYVYSYFDSSGKHVGDFYGLSEMKKLGFNQSCVWACCTGKAKHHKGYTFSRRLKSE